MEINLEKIDEIVKRTGVSYEKARDALIKSNGDVVQAIIYIEQNRLEISNFDKKKKKKINEILEFLKDLIKKGNVSRIIICKNDRNILDIPVTVGAVVGIFFVTPTLLTIAISIFTGCDLKIVDNNDKEYVLSSDKIKEKLKFYKNENNDFKEFEEDNNEEEN